MWLDVRWRAPAVQGEAELIDEVHRLLSKAFPLEPGLPYPWHAWRELARVRGLYDHMAGQVIDRAKNVPAPASLIGYRRTQVVLTHAGWVLEVPGSFAEVRTEDELWVGGAGRTITLAATATGTPTGPMSAQDFLDQVAGDLGSKALTHRAGPLLGRARLMTDSSSGVEIGVVEGFMAVRGSGAVVRITFDDPEDWHWALDTWAGARPGLRARMPPSPESRSITRRGGGDEQRNTGAAASGGAIYGLGIFGALVYFWQQADSLLEYVFAVVQGLFWPAWMVYELFDTLAA